MTAYEIGYTGVIAAAPPCRPRSTGTTPKDGIYFTPDAVYSAANPPPGWPLPVRHSCAAGCAAVALHLPEPRHDQGQGVRARRRCRGEPVHQRLHELLVSVDARVEDFPAGTTIRDINWPAKNRFNAGFNFSYGRFLGNLSVSYTDEAYWQDVLDARMPARPTPTRW